MSRKDTKAIFLIKEMPKSSSTEMDESTDADYSSDQDYVSEEEQEIIAKKQKKTITRSASNLSAKKNANGLDSAVNISKNDIGGKMYDKKQLDTAGAVANAKKNKKKQVLPKDAADKYISRRNKRAERAGERAEYNGRADNLDKINFNAIQVAAPHAAASHASPPPQSAADDGEIEVHNISPAELRNLLGLVDEDAVHTQKDMIREYKMYLNSLDWKSGFKRTEIKKYQQIWDDICDAIVHVPLISDVLRLKIGIPEKADFVHKLLVLYGMPMDSFEFIHTKKTLMAQYKKYEAMQLTPQQLTEFGEMEKRMMALAEYQSALKYAILGSGMIDKNKSFVFTKYQQLLTEPDNGKLKVWVNTALSLPTTSHAAASFKKLTPRNIDKYLCDIKRVLDEELFGMDQVKEQLLFFINNKISRQDTNGAALALEGLPGIGKTCIVQALAKALDIPMVSIPIGGAKDSSFLTGFSFTYEGAQPGAIVQALQELKCNNGIIFIDEIDKIPHTDKGNEISKALLHIIDPAQNHAFHDKYMSNQFDIDLSKIWFIYTLNRREDIERTLCDRIPIIKVDGYSYQEKCEIAAMHLIPKALKNLNINPADVQFSPEAIRYMLNLLQENQTEIADSEGRSGVRQLKYLISHIAMKINMLRNLWDPSSKYTHKLQLSFGIQNFQIPLIVTPDIIAELGITNFYKPENLRHLSMYS